ncbi:MAG: alpha-ribazole phosphatase [Nitrospinales bacterium]
MPDQKGCRVYLLRHGETANSKYNCFNGHFDVELSPLGREQMRQAADVLKDKPVRCVYSSDLKRTVEGARIIAESHGLIPITYPELRELSVGKWEGLSVDEVNRRYPGELEERMKNISSFQVEGGESIQELQTRVLEKFQKIVTQHEEESIVVVAHGGVNRIILFHHLEIPLNNFFRMKQDFAAINILQFYSGSAVIEMINGSSGRIP